MTTLQARLEELDVEASILTLMLDVASKTTCEPYAHSRDKNSVPCVAEQGGQVALYPMRRRLGIALEPTDAAAWAIRTGGGLQKKTPQTWYVIVGDSQLSDAALRAAALDACLHSLHTVGGRKGSQRQVNDAPEPDLWGSCPHHGYIHDALGCPSCRGE